VTAAYQANVALTPGPPARRPGDAPNPLVVIETHPIQYHAPVYRDVESSLGIPVTVIYGSDFSVAGYCDREFGASFRWDTDLLSGYTASFLSTVSAGGASTAEQVHARGLSAAVSAVRPGAILLTGYSPRFHRSAWIAALRSRCPVLLRAETTDHAQERSRTRAWLRTMALRRFYRACARLLYVGCQSHQHFARLASPDKLVFAPYCVDTSAFQCGEEARAQLRPAAREALNVGVTDTVLLFSGKLSPRKGPDLLLDAVRLLPAEIRHAVTVVFLGSGELQAELQKLSHNVPAVHTRFLGFQNQTQLSRYYHAADLLVLPSRHSETWGLVVNEALHHGVPCVVSQAVGCAPDLVEAGVTGEIAATCSTESLTAALQRALALVGRPETRQMCRAKVAGYSVEIAAQGIAEAYWAVVKRN